MALNAYTIYGDPIVKESQPNDPRTLLEADSTITEQTAELTNRAFRGSTFVPAQRTYDELGRPLADDNQKENPKRLNTSSNTVGDWYTSLQRAHNVTPQPAVTQHKGKGVETSRTSSDERRPKASSSASMTQQGPSKPDWFRSSPMQTATKRPKLPSLAEMLRNDPPDPQNPLEPPVYYGIGPTNKGYEMLTKSGWVEGRPLGPHSHGSDVNKSKKPIEKSSKAVNLEESRVFLSGDMPTLVLPGRLPGQIQTIRLRRGDSTDEDEDNKDNSDGSEDEDDTIFNQPAGSTSRASSPGSSSSERSKKDREIIDDRTGKKFDRPLLTPIAVALKNDRKGLGLSKTKRLVTHSSLALREHAQKSKFTRRHQISEMKRMERDFKRGQYGRGKRAYAKMAKEDAAKRQRLMEYMNT
jgi:hypothetical protein